MEIKLNRGLFCSVTIRLINKNKEIIMVSWDKRPVRFVYSPWVWQNWTTRSGVTNKSNYNEKKKKTITKTQRSLQCVFWRRWTDEKGAYSSKSVQEIASARWRILCTLLLSNYYRNPSGSGNTTRRACVFHNFLSSPELSQECLQFDRNTKNIFSIFFKNIPLRKKENNWFTARSTTRASSVFLTNTILNQAACVKLRVHCTIQLQAWCVSLLCTQSYLAKIGSVDFQFDLHWKARWSGAWERFLYWHKNGLKTWNKQR